MHKYSELLRKSIALGVRGYVLKDSGAGEVIDAVRSVAKGQDYLSPAVSGLLVKELRSCGGNGSAAGIKSLTAVQRRVLRLVASDLISKEIAEELGLSVRTVENHRARICRKLCLSGAHSLVKFAFDHRDEL
jgi:DNA-binding NarL/FixJ family response regulator